MAYEIEDVVTAEPLLGPEVQTGPSVMAQRFSPKTLPKNLKASPLSRAVLRIDSGLKLRTQTTILFLARHFVFIF